VKCAGTDYAGKILGEIAREKKSDPLELMFDMMVTDPETIWIQHLDRRGSEVMNAVYLDHPAAYPCTDTFALPCEPVAGEWFMGFDLGTPPPIAYGLFPHYINTYIKKLKIFSLEEGIKKATYLPAQRFGLKDRGILKQGAFADIVVFNAQTIKDNLDFADPAQAPSGIEYVLVNGTIVHKDNAHTGAKPGKVLRHSFSK
jgi:N-acyl-D-aspartate/D-glutamate deacylase